MGKNWQRDGGRACSCYWVAVALWVNSFTDRTSACVFAIADFMINPARAGTQTHMDLSEASTRRGWEPMATRTSKETVNRARRLMG
jgi:hypothetical protein